MEWLLTRKNKSLTSANHIFRLPTARSSALINQLQRVRQPASPAAHCTCNFRFRFNKSKVLTGRRSITPLINLITPIFNPAGNYNAINHNESELERTWTPVPSTPDISSRSGRGPSFSCSLLKESERNGTSGLAFGANIIYGSGDRGSFSNICFLQRQVSLDVSDNIP